MELYQIFIENPIVCTDTRSILPNSIFFALKGPTFDANEFADEALEKGSAYVIIDEEKYKKDERYIVVADVLTTLQDLAKYHREQLNIPIIGITGTNGKTTTKELLYAVLSQKYNVLATEGNLNNHIGVPLTILNITSKHEIAIIEMGANHQKEIGFLCDIALPGFGVITNIGKAHLEGFGGFEGVVNTKKELYTFIDDTDGILFVNKDDALLSELSFHCERITYGSTDNVDFVGSFEGCEPFVQMKCMPNDDEEELEKMSVISTQLVGNYNYDNILAAACIGNYFEVSPGQIKEGLENYVPSNNRSQVIQTDNNMVLLDAYNANPTSMEAAIKSLVEMKAPNKMVVLGDMLELGDDSLVEHQNIIELLKQNQIESIYVVGENFKNVATDRVLSFTTSIELGKYLENNPPINATILVKGSRGIGLEKITCFL